MKRVFISVLMMLGLSVMPSMAQTQIGLEIGYDNPVIGNGDHPRTPIKSVYITQDDYEITLPTLGYDISLQLFDENGYVVYSVYVPAGTTLVYLPTTLSGEFEIRLVTSSFYFYGFITL